VSLVITISFKIFIFVNKEGSNGKFNWKLAPVVAVLKEASVLFDIKINLATF